MSINTTASDLGRELYRAVWQLVKENFFDIARLQEWSSYEHRFDEQIVDEESALRCIDQMLASLKDDFTWAERVIVPVTSAASTAIARATATDADAASEPVGAEPVSAEPVVATAEPEPVLAVLRPDGIGYIRIMTFDRPDILDLVEAGVRKIASCDGVVLDLRNNVGGDIQITAAACGFFLSEGLVTTMETRNASGDIDRTEFAFSQDEFFVNEHIAGGASTCKRYVRAEPLLADKPLVILISKHTMSAAELMTVALVQQGTAGKVLMVGNGATPGKGIGQTNYLFMDGKYRVRLTRVRWLAPGGDWLGDCGQTERNAIEPDVLVTDDRGLEGVQVAFRELRQMLSATASGAPVSA